MVRTLTLTFLLLFLTCSMTLSGVELEEFYGNLSDFFAAHMDPNTGLTVFPALNIPMGGAYEGMGTAYTAVAGDSSFLEANPSASSIQQYSELAFLHNDWIADSRVEGVIYTMRINDLGLGFGGKFLYLPFQQYDAWGERLAKGFYAETVATMNVSYNFFSSYDFYGLAVGGNFKLAYRHVPEEIYPGQSALAPMFDVGVLTRVNFLKFYSSRNKNFSVGLVMKNMGPLVQNEPLPTLLTAGIAYSPIRPFTIAVDFNQPFAFGYPPESWEAWFLAGGLNVVITDFFSMQGGFRVRGANPRLSVGSTVDVGKVSFVVNFTLDLATQLNLNSGSLDRFSIMAKINLGDSGRLALRSQVESLYFQGLEAYAQGNLKEAIAFWSEALLIDPSFQPAAESIKTAQRAIELQHKMESLQKVE